jgi:hypothetical protein
LPQTVPKRRRDFEPGKAIVRSLGLRKNALRAEGEKVVHRIRKFVEVESGRIGYALTAAVLSKATNGARWEPDPSFSVADVILDNPEFVSVLRAVLDNGHVFVPAPKAKVK